MIKGYARVSSLSQKLERQIVTLREAGCEIIYQDKASGKDLNRSEYQKMKAELQPGDCVVFTSLDRLSQNPIHFGIEIQNNFGKLIF